MVAARVGEHPKLENRFPRIHFCCPICGHSGQTVDTWVDATNSDCDDTNNTSAMFKKSRPEMNRVNTTNAVCVGPMISNARAALIDGWSK